MTIAFQVGHRSQKVHGSDTVALNSVLLDDRLVGLLIPITLRIRIKAWSFMQSFAAQFGLDGVKVLSVDTVWVATFINEILCKHEMSWFLSNLVQS